MHAAVSPVGHDRLRASDSVGHRVQFYEDDEYLVETVADFLAGGLTIGQPTIVIATPQHRTGFGERLAIEGFDADDLMGSGRLVMLDARATLDAFMTGALPDASRFLTVVGSEIDACLVGRDDQPVLRLYGEMVDLLWRDGNTDGALRLEELWNALAEGYKFSLLCAYSMGNFYRADDAERFQELCRQHTHVLPTERYMRADENERLVEVSVLQQRARALETEIEERRALERRLCEREQALERVERRQRHLLSLINNMSNLARIETGHVDNGVDDFALGPADCRDGVDARAVDRGEPPNVRNGHDIAGAPGRGRSAR